MNQQNKRMQHSYDDMFQSTNVEGPTTFTIYNTYDEVSSRMMEPTHDEDSTPYLIYDVDDEDDLIST
jgi:hypothetical protein